MKIALIDLLGLTYDGSTLTKRGLGGSESAVIYISKELVKLGIDVTVFNDCTSDDSKPGIYDGVLYLPLEMASSMGGFDVVIASRSVAALTPKEWGRSFKTHGKDLPDFTKLLENNPHRVLIMHDTFSDGDDLIEPLINQGLLHEIFTLSDWHTAYVTNCDHGLRRNFDILKDKIFMTRNGIGNKPDFVDISKKDYNLFVYNASVTKGMIPLVTKIWPEIKKKIPDAKLKVIGGYYKFRENAEPDQQEQDWRKLVAEYSDLVEFTGIITQKEISEILTEASWFLYPTAFPETFGISTLEALAHNCEILTCRFGALEETAIDLASTKLNYPVEKNWSLPWLDEDAQCKAFVEMVISAYNNPYLHQQKQYAAEAVKEICGWDSVALQWKQHLYKVTGRYLPIEEFREVNSINHKVRKIFNRRFMNKVELLEPKQSEQNITVIIPVYNGSAYIVRCLDSITSQNYKNYSILLVNDASTDNTHDVIIKWYNENEDKPIWYHENKTNIGALANQIKLIEYAEDGIVVLIDGDDSLVNSPDIFDKINNLYSEGYKFTYGSCWSMVDGIPLIAQEYPPEVKKNKSYRQHNFNWGIPYTHLRTFDTELFDRIKDHSGLKDETGNYFKAGGDGALFYELIEHCEPHRIKAVQEILYNYNDSSPLNDYKVNSEEQTRNAKLIKDRTK